MVESREQKEKQEAKDKYWKLHVQGKTDQAKTDLARLARIRAEREEAQAKRKAETEGSSAYCCIVHPQVNTAHNHKAKTAEIEAKKKAQQGGKRI